MREKDGRFMDSGTIPPTRITFNGESARPGQGTVNPTPESANFQFGTAGRPRISSTSKRIAAGSSPGPMQTSEEGALARPSIS